MSFDSLMNKSGTIVRKIVAGVDSWNQSTTTPAIVATISCAIQPRSSKETEWDRQGIVYTHELYSREPVVLILGQDSVICDGITYTVEGVADGAGRGHHLEVALKQVV